MTRKQPVDNHEAYRRNYEPIRSRLQIDMSKQARNAIYDIAKLIGSNPKTIVIMALVDKYPEISHMLLPEIRNSKQSTFKHYNLTDESE